MPYNFEPGYAEQELQHASERDRKRDSETSMQVAGCSV